jgi:hypothetical protein
MLSRPEIGTREHVMQWLGSKPESEPYMWMPASMCPAQVYRFDHDLPGLWTSPNELADLAAGFPRTWGGLHDRARKAWGG